MSLSVDGFWKAGFWAPNFWADGFWFEGAAASPVAGSTNAGGGAITIRSRRPYSPIVYPVREPFAPYRPPAVVEEDEAILIALGIA